MQKTVILIDDDQEDLDIMKQAIQTVDPSLLCPQFYISGGSVTGTPDKWFEGA